MRTRSSNSRMATPFANPKIQFQTRRDTSPTPIHNIYTFYESESSKSESEDVGEIDIETLTLEKYVTFKNTRRRMSNPENTTFEIKRQFLRVLRKTTFSGINRAYRKVGVAKRWFNITSPEHAKNWDTLKQNFIQRFCPPAMILEQLGEIHNFKQEDGESLFHTWERLNDLLFKCLFHDLNDHQIVTSEALKLIQKLDDHSYKWYNEESKDTPTPFSIITEKFKALNHEMDELRVDVPKINTNKEMKSLHEEIKSIRTSEISYNKSSPKSNIHPTNLKDTSEHYLKESCKRQDTLNEWMKKFMINTEINLKNHDSSIKRLKENVNHIVQLIFTHNPTNQKCAIKLEPSREKPTPKVETFIEKVKISILKKNSKGGSIHTTSVNTKQNLISRKVKNEEVSTVKLNARCSGILQNELPPKEKDPRSFILPCAIEMVDRSMQLSKGIVENVLVKINKFIFPVDFIILDIVEDDKFPIILGRPMLATTHASIDVFVLLSPPVSARLNNDSSNMLCNPNSNLSISMDDLVEMEEVWDNLDFRDLTNEATKFPVKPKFLRSSNRIHLHIPYNLQITCKIRDDKTIFNMSRAKKRFGKLTVRQHNTMGPILKISDEDKSRGIYHPYQKIKGFYRGCLELGDEYKHNQEGFTAALAVLITGASQSRQHGKSEPTQWCTLVLVIEAGADCL
nr:hypothetical protein [Tanacetum cinerariifolium]